VTVSSWHSLPFPRFINCNCCHAIHACSATAAFLGLAACAFGTVLAAGEVGAFPGGLFLQIAIVGLVVGLIGA
jgi:hypothetical protein